MKSISISTTNFFLYFSYAMVLASSITPTLSILKYLIIFLLPTWLFIFGNTKFRIRQIYHPFLLLLVCGLINPNSWHVDGLKDLTFIALPAIYLMAYPRPTVSLNALFLLTILFFTISIPSIYDSSMGFSFVNSSSPLESTYSFLFGIFCIAYLYKKRWAEFFISLLLALLTLKRIVVLGIFAIAILEVINSARLLNLITPRLATAANVALLAASIAFTLGLFDDQFNAITGLSANAFTEGRQFLYGIVTIKILQDPLAYLLYGEGAGGYYNLAIAAFGRIVLLHNDILKVAFEYGLITLLIFIYLIYRPFKGREKYFPIFINLCFLTDNILIYFQVIFTFILILNALGLPSNESYSHN